MRTDYPLICPLHAIGTSCITAQCAWWCEIDEKTGRCALAAIALLTRDE